MVVNGLADTGASGCFVTGIGTGVGKTVVAAVLAAAMGWDYWKPVQSGDLEASDSDRVRTLAPQVRVWPEAYRLTQPLSPHASAALEDRHLELNRMRRPTAAPLVVEGAGGVLVPLSYTHLMVDLMAQLALPAVVVTRSYLGSINHTLLTLEVLRTRGVAVAGLVFVGPPNPPSDQAILEFSGGRELARVSWAEEVDAGFVAKEAGRLRGSLHGLG